MAGPTGNNKTITALAMALDRVLAAFRAAAECDPKLVNQR
jgi:hypothetical protein